MGWFSKKQNVNEETKVEEKAGEAPKATGDDAGGTKVYHVNKRLLDKKWTIKFAKGKKVIKIFNTKEEAVEYANKLAENQGGTVLVHASKGKNKGKIMKS